VSAVDWIKAACAVLQLTGAAAAAGYLAQEHWRTRKDEARRASNIAQWAARDEPQV
jgi:hypothetical protein